MQGLYFEEFEIGRVFDHTIRRTVTEAAAAHRPRISASRRPSGASR